MKVSVVQYEAGRTTGLPKFVERVKKLTEECARNGVDLLLLPEYVCVDLIPELRTRGIIPADSGLREALLHLPELNIELFSELAVVATNAGIALAAGTYLERAVDGRLYNAAQVFLPDGRRISQPKMHVAYELTVNANDMSPGDAINVWEIAGCRVATLVCYDAQFPESARALLDEQRVDLMLVPGCALEPWGIERMRTGAAARAMESFAFVATAHLVGEVPILGGESLVFWGRSAIFGPISRPFPVDGVLVDSLGSGEMIVSADLDIDLLRNSLPDGFPRSSDRRSCLPVHVF